MHGIQCIEYNHKNIMPMIQCIEYSYIIQHMKYKEYNKIQRIKSKQKKQKIQCKEYNAENARHKIRCIQNNA